MTNNMATMMVNDAGEMVDAASTISFAGASTPGSTIVMVTVI